jgi:hypothetical protein
METFMSRIIGSYSLPPEVVNQLLEASKRQDRPISWLVRDALVLYLPQVIGMDSEEAISRNDSSELSFDPDLSSQIDLTRSLIELETNELRHWFLVSYLSLLEKEIPCEN